MREDVRSNSTNFHFNRHPVPNRRQVEARVDLTKLKKGSNRGLSPSSGSLAQSPASTIRYIIVSPVPARPRLDASSILLTTLVDPF